MPEPVNTEAAPDRGAVATELLESADSLAEFTRLRENPETLRTEVDKKIEAAKPAETDPAAPGKSADPAEEKPDESKPEGESETPDQEQQEEDDTPEPPKAKGRGGFQKRIDKLTAETYRLEAERAALEKQLAEKAGKADEKPTQKPDGMPTLDQFENLEEYVAALSDWKVEQKVQALRAEDAQQKQEARNREQAVAWNAKLEQARNAHPDFDGVLENLDPRTPVTPVMQEAMRDSEQGAEIAYFLAKNPKECTRLAALPPVTQVRELGRIEARIQAEQESQKKPSPTEPKPKISKAAPPISPVGTSAAPVAKDAAYWKDDNRLAEFSAERAAGRV